MRSGATRCRPRPQSPRGRSHLVRNGRGGGRNGPARETSKGGTGRKIYRTQEGSAEMFGGLLNVFLETIPNGDVYPPPFPPPLSTMGRRPLSLPRALLLCYAARRYAYGIDGTR